MSDRTAERAFRLQGSQGYSQEVNVRNDTEAEISRSSSRKPIIQESSTEEAIGVNSGSEEETQGAYVDEEMVMTSIFVDPDDEEEAASKQDFVMTWVKTQRIECLHPDTVVQSLRVF